MEFCKITAIINRYKLEAVEDKLLEWGDSERRHPRSRAKARFFNEAIGNLDRKLLVKLTVYCTSYSRVRFTHQACFG